LHQLIAFNYLYHRHLAKELLVANPKMGKVFLTTLRQLNRTGVSFESLLNNEYFFPFFLEREEQVFLFTDNQQETLSRFGEKEAIILANTYFTIKNNIILNTPNNQKFLATLLLDSKSDEENNVLQLDREWLQTIISNFITLKTHIEPFFLLFHEGHYANSMMFYEKIYPYYNIKSKEQSYYPLIVINDLSSVLMLVKKILTNNLAGLKVSSNTSHKLSRFAYNNLASFYLDSIENKKQVSYQELLKYIKQKINFEQKNSIFFLNPLEVKLMLSLFNNPELSVKIDNLFVKKETKLVKQSSIKKDIFKLFNDSEIEKISFLMNESEHRKMLSGIFEKMDKAQYKTASLIHNKESLNNNILTLKQEFPNFLKVIEYIEKQCLLALKGDKKFYFHPILLLGEPGLGKTFFSHRVAELFEIHYEAVHFETTSASFSLTGGDSQWASAKIGILAKTLLTNDNINPLFLLDEIDKSIGNSYPAINSLYSLLERNTAKTFEDEFLKIKMDLSFVNYIATANYISSIPEPLLNRVNVFEINVPNKEQSIVIAKNIYTNILKNESWGNFFEKELDVSAFEELCLFSPRQMSVLITEALGNAVVADRNYLLKEDFDFNKKTANMGFKF
jgi:ATP-dependent Lon protease